MRYFCHAQLFEITRANKIEIPYFATIVPKRLSCARIRGRNSSNFLSRAPLTNPYSHSLLRRCPTSRDFVPWRFLDAGQLSVRSLLVAGVQKPAQNRKSRSRPTRSNRWCRETGWRVTHEVLLCGGRRYTSEPAVDRYGLPIQIFGNGAQSQGAGPPSS